MKNRLLNWRGGLTGVAIFVVIWVVVWFIAFMTAFGNDSPAAQAILHGVAAFAVVANPLWGIPVCVLCGSVHRGDEPERPGNLNVIIPLAVP